MCDIALGLQRGPEAGCFLLHPSVLRKPGERPGFDTMLISARILLIVVLAASCRKTSLEVLSDWSGVTGSFGGEEGSFFTSSVEKRTDASRWFDASISANFLLRETGG